MVVHLDAQVEQDFLTCFLQEVPAKEAEQRPKQKHAQQAKGDVLEEVHVLLNSWRGEGIADVVSA